MKMVNDVSTKIHLTHSYLLFVRIIMIMAVEELLFLFFVLLYAFFIKLFILWNYKSFVNDFLVLLLLFNMISAVQSVNCSSMYIHVYMYTSHNENVSKQCPRLLSITIKSLFLAVYLTFNTFQKGFKWQTIVI